MAMTILSCPLHHETSLFVSPIILGIINTLRCTEIWRRSKNLTFCRPQELRQKCREALASELLWLETQTDTEGPYFLGAQFSAVDCAILPWFLRLYILKHYRNFELPKKCQRLISWWVWAFNFFNITCSNQISFKSNCLNQVVSINLVHPSCVIYASTCCMTRMMRTSIVFGRFCLEYARTIIQEQEHVVYVSVTNA